MTVSDWQATLQAACRKFNIPGASLAVRHGSREVAAAAGVTSIASKAPVTTETIFALGSLTKSFTAMLAMQQVRVGHLQLDEDIRALLPAFPHADVTLRRLLSHKSGFFGDILDSPSTDADAIAAYAAASERLEPVVAAGLAFSYNNAAFVIAARLTEIAADIPWEQQFIDGIVRPLGMKRTGIVASMCPDDDVAHPHGVDADGNAMALPPQTPPRALAPAGATGWTTASDLLRFADALQLETAMRGLETIGPTPTFATAWGLGLQHFTANGSAFGHDGAVAGQNSFLRIIPDAGLTIALLTNGGDARGGFSHVLATAEQLVGSALVDPVPEWPNETRVDNHARYVGDYAVSRYRVEVRSNSEGLNAQFIPAPNAGDFADPFRLEMRRQLDDPTGELMLARFANSSLPTQQRFLRADGGKRFLLFRGRLLPEVIS